MLPGLFRGFRERASTDTGLTPSSTFAQPLWVGSWVQIMVDELRGMDMRKALSLILTTVALLAVSAVPVSAAPPIDVSITALEILPATAGGTFAASGPAVSAGLICAGGTTTNGPLGAVHGTDPVRFRIDKTFDCAGSSDTFSLRLHVTLNVDTGDTTAKWKVTSSTGTLAGLKGHGTLVGTPSMVGDSITDVYTGRLR